MSGPMCNAVPEDSINGILEDSLKMAHDASSRADNIAAKLFNPPSEPSSTPKGGEAPSTSSHARNLRCTISDVLSKLQAISNRIA
jgi:hypothetical protein